MKKTFRMENLDCANCAAKMEQAIGKLSGVETCTVAFMTQRLTLVADDNRFDEILEQAQACVKKVDADCRIVR